PDSAQALVQSLSARGDRVQSGSEEGKERRGGGAGASIVDAGPGRREGFSHATMHDESRQGGCTWGVRHSDPCRFLLPTLFVFVGSLFCVFCFFFFFVLFFFFF